MKKKPFDDLEGLFNLQDQLQRMFQEKGELLPTAAVGWSPVADVFETEDKFLILMEIPGVKRADVELVVEGRDLRIRGMKNPCPELSASNFHRLEREFGDFRRIFRFEVPIDSQRVSATIRQGVLSIEVAKQIAQIQVEAGPTI